MWFYRIFISLSISTDSQQTNIQDTFKWTEEEMYGKIKSGLKW